MRRSPDVVDHCGAGGQGLAGHAGLVSIDADGDGDGGADGGQGGQQAAGFGGGGYGSAAGAGGFGAYVDDVGAVGGHPAGQGHGGVRVAGQAVAGEGVGRQVDDAHYGGAAAPDGRRAAGFVAGGGEGQRGWGRGQVAGGPVIRRPAVGGCCLGWRQGNLNRAVGRAGAARR